MRRLNIYNDNNHPHQAQTPIELNISDFYSHPQFNTNISELN
jgi:ribosomal protein L13